MGYWGGFGGDYGGGWTGEGGWLVGPSDGGDGGGKQWSWSVKEGWKYGGVSVPEGPTSTPGVAYDASRDPALASVFADAAKAKATEGKYWEWDTEKGWKYGGIPMKSGPTTREGVAYDPTTDPVLLGHFAEEAAKATAEAKKTAKEREETAEEISRDIEITSDPETGKLYDVSKPVAPREVTVSEKGLITLGGVPASKAESAVIFSQLIKGGKPAYMAAKERAAEIKTGLPSITTEEAEVVVSDEGTPYEPLAYDPLHYEPVFEEDRKLTVPGKIEKGFFEYDKKATPEVTVKGAGIGVIPEVTSPQDIVADPETGKLYDVSDPAIPQEVVVDSYDPETKAISYKYATKIGTPKAADKPIGQVVDKPNKKEFDKIIKENKTVIVEIGQSKCPACVGVHENLDKVAADNPNIKYVYAEDPDIVREAIVKFGLKTVPAVVIYKNGVLQDDLLHGKTEGSAENIEALVPTITPTVTEEPEITEPEEPTEPKITVPERIEKEFFEYEEAPDAEVIAPRTKEEIAEVFKDVEAGAVLETEPDITCEDGVCTIPDAEWEQKLTEKGVPSLDVKGFRKTSPYVPPAVAKPSIPWPEEEVPPEVIMPEAPPVEPVQPTLPEWDGNKPYIDSEVEQAKVLAENTISNTQNLVDALNRGVREEFLMAQGFKFEDIQTAKTLANPDRPTLTLESEQSQVLKETGRSGGVDLIAAMEQGVRAEFLMAMGFPFESIMIAKGSRDLGLGGYRTGEGKFDIAALLRDGKSPEEVAKIFGWDAVKAAQDYLTFEELVAKHDNVYEAIKNELTTQERINLFTRILGKEDFESIMDIIRAENQIKAVSKEGVDPLITALQFGLPSEKLNLLYTKEQVEEGKDILSTIDKLEPYMEVKEGIETYRINEYASDEREKGRSPAEIAEELTNIGFDDKTVAEIQASLIPDGMPTESEFINIRTDFGKYRQYVQEQPTDPRVQTGLIKYSDAQLMASKDVVERMVAKSDILARKFATAIEKGRGNLAGKAEDMPTPIVTAMEALANSAMLNAGYLIQAAKADPFTGEKATEIIDLATGKITEAKKAVAELDMIELIEKTFNIPKDAHIAQAAGTAIGFVLDVVKTIGGVVPLTVLNAQIASAEGEYDKAVMDMAELTGGFVVFPVLFPGMVAGAVEVGKPGKAAGLVAGLGLTFLVSPAKVMDIARATKTKLAPRITSDTALGVNISLNTMRPEWLIPEVRRKAINLVENIITKTIPKEAVPKVLKTGRDLVGRTQDGLINYRVAPIERAGTRDVVWHVTSDQKVVSPTGETLLNFSDAFNTGGITIVPGQPFGGVYSTKQPAWNFLTRRKPSNPAIVATITSSKDYRTLPKEVISLLEQDKLADAKRLVQKMEKEGQLPKGLIDTSKWTKRGTVELEWWMTKDTQLLPIPKEDIPWWARVKDENTAVTYSPSPVSYKESPPIVKGKLQDGYKNVGVNKWRDADMNLFERKDNKWIKNGKDWKPIEIKEGQLIPVYWAITKEALAEGRKMPSLAQMYKAEFLDVLTGARKMLSRVERQRATSEYGLATSRRLETKLKALEMKLPRETKKGIIGPELRTAKEALSEKHLMRRSVWDEWVNPEGQIQVLRPPVPHPSGKGEMRTRVEVIPITNKGEIVMGHAYADNAPKDVFSFPGGGVHITERGGRAIRGGISVEIAQPKGISLTYGDSFKSVALQQLKEELGLIGKDTKYLGVDFGKGKDYGLTGFRVYTTEVKGVPDPLRYHVEGVGRAKPGTKTEIDSFTVWNPKGDKTITVYPDTYYMLEGLAIKQPELGINMAKVKMYKGKGMERIMKAVDRDFAQRIKEGTMPTEAQIRDVAQKRAKMVEERTAKIAEEFAKEWVGPIPPSLVDLILEVAREEKGGIFKKAGEIAKDVTERRVSMTEGEAQAVMTHLDGLAKAVREANKKGLKPKEYVKSPEIVRNVREILKEMDRFSRKRRGEEIPYRPRTIDMIEYPRIIAEERITPYEAVRLDVRPSEYVTMRADVRTDIRPSAYPTLGRPRIADYPQLGGGTRAYPYPETPYKYLKPEVPYTFPPPPEKPYKPPPPLPSAKMPPPIPPPPVVTTRKGIVWAYKGHELTQDQWDDAIAWKQGWIYRFIYPPYRKENVIHSKYPLAGVTYDTGKGSPQRSIIARGDDPMLVKRDMGIFDVEIRRAGDGKLKPSLSFTPDPHQKTAVTPGAKPKVKPKPKAKIGYTTPNLGLLAGGKKENNYAVPFAIQNRKGSYTSYPVLKKKKNGKKSNTYTTPGILIGK